MTVLAILAGALMTVASAWAVGRLAMQRLSLAGGAPGAMSFGVGASCLSLLIFALCSLQLASVGSFVTLAALLVAVSAWALRPTLRFPRLSPWLAPFALFGTIYFVQALAPEVSADGSYYHVAFPARYLDHGGFYRITDNMYASLSQGLEMLFLFAFSIGRHSSTALVHLSFLIALSAAIVAYGRTFAGATATGWLAALIVFTTPVAGRDASIAYNDVAAACLVFLTFFALEIWDRDRNVNWLLVAGLLAGSCYAVKYSAGIAVPFAIGFVAWRARSLRPILVVLAAALLPMLPWMLKNWIWLDNPMSPFLNRIFPNPYIHVSTEEDYTRAMRNFGGAAIGLDTPLDLTVRGGRLQGLTGPAFLLTPLALLGLGDSTGRRLLAAGIVFLLPWFLNIGTRFLIPALAFFALAIARVVARRNWMAVAFAAAQTVVAFPPVVNSYADPYAWRISDFPWQAALRLTPEREFIDSRLDTMPILRMIDANTPPNAVIYTALPLPQAYSKRTILLNYTSALANELQDLRWSPLRVADQPIAKTVFTFPPIETRAIRLRHRGQPESCPGAWTIAELNVFRAGQVLPRDGWQWTSKYDPWKLAWAFDGNSATRWRLWRTPNADASLVVRFPQPVTIDQVRSDGTGDPANGCVMLDAETASGEWRAIDAAPVHAAAGMDALAVRREAGRAIRELGVTHLLIHRDEKQAGDFDSHALHWGVRKVSEEGPGRLYEFTK